MKTLWMASTALLLPLSSMSQAADVKAFDGKPGLWESTTTMDTDGMPAMPTMPQIPQDKLDKMPPAQRAQLEAMLKNRGGAGAPRTFTGKSCNTKESMAKGMAAPRSKDVNCTQEVISSTSSRMQVHMTCTPTGGGPTSTSDVTIDRIDSEHVKGNMISKTEVQGKAMTMKLTFDSKWVSADCGDVKPYSSK